MRCVWVVVVVVRCEARQGKAATTRCDGCSGLLMLVLVLDVCSWLTNRVREFFQSECGSS